MELAQLSEPEATFISEDAAMLQPVFSPGDGEGCWRLMSRAVELAGYLPGDLLLVSQKVSPLAGDVVCAQIYDGQTDSAETVFRVYEPPFIITRTMDPAHSQKPRIVDNERVVIWGTVIRSFRERKPHD